MAQHSRRYKYQKIKPKFNRRLYFGFRVRWGYVDKVLKIKIKFNYKLYFGQISHNDVILTTQYNPWLNSLAVF